MNENVNLMKQNMIQLNVGIMINLSHLRECKKINVCEKDYVWNPVTCNCENGKYLASIMDDSANICDEVIKSYDEEI